MMARKAKQPAAPQMAARITAEDCRREAQKCIDESKKATGKLGGDWLVLAELWVTMAEAVKTEMAIKK
jgi:predicted GIY-YIG superfamily endonuclease